MVQRLIAYSLLFLHINGSMLLPQVGEQDVYFNGRQVDDISSMIEFISQVVLNISDETPEDEDDDNGQNFSSTKFGSEVCEQNFEWLQVERPAMEIVHKFFEPSGSKAFLISFDTVKPPPKA